MLRIELTKEHYENIMFITNNKLLVNKNEIMVYLEKYFPKDYVESIKTSDSELLCFAKVC